MSFNFSDMLTNTATIKRFVITDSANGGTKKTFTAVSGMSGLSCSIQPVSGDKYEFAKKLQMSVSHVAYFDSVLALQNGDLLNDGTSDYQIRYFDAQGGAGNIIGDVFAVYCDLIRG